MAIDDVSTLRVVGRYQSQNIVNTMHYRHDAQTSGEDQILDQLITAWRAALEATWDGVHIDTYTLVGIKAFKKTGAAKVPRFQSVNSPGLVTGVETPSPVCRTITLYTASSNPRRRGRIMLSGSDTQMFDQTDGSLTIVEITNLNSLGALLLNTLTVGGDDFELCIPPANGSPTEDIIEAIARETPSCVTSRRVRQFFVG